MMLARISSRVAAGLEFRMEPMRSSAVPEKALIEALQ